MAFVLLRSLASSQKRKCTRGNCDFAHQDTSFSRFLSVLDSATKTLDVCVFTITNDEIARSLVNAHKRGVNVRCITDDECSLAKGLIHIWSMFDLELFLSPMLFEGGTFPFTLCLTAWFIFILFRFAGSDIFDMWQNGIDVRLDSTWMTPLAVLFVLFFSQSISECWWLHSLNGCFWKVVCVVLLSFFLSFHPPAIQNHQPSTLYHHPPPLHTRQNPILPKQTLRRTCTTSSPSSTAA